MLKDCVKLAGHIGTWYLVDEYAYGGYTFYEWESEKYGDEAPHIITWAHYIVVLEDVWNGILDLQENFEEVSKKVSYILEHLQCCQDNDYLEKIQIGKEAIKKMIEDLKKE